MGLEITRGDITDMAVDAIVNAANKNFAKGGGVCGAIYRAAGEDVLAAEIKTKLAATEKARRELIEDGYKKPRPIIITGGHFLPAKNIIHVTSQHYWFGLFGDFAKLVGCYRAALYAAKDLGAASVAFPLIGAGSYGCRLKKRCGRRWRRLLIGLRRAGRR